MTTRDIRLNVIAETKKFQQDMLREIPGTTEKAASAAARKMITQFAKAAGAQAKQQEKAAKASAEAWEDFGTVFTASLSADAIQGAASALFDFTQDIMDILDSLVGHL